METKITTVSLAAKEDKYYADKTLYQWNYGQILRIVDADLPMVVEVGFSTTEKSGNSDVRVGSTNNGVTTVAIPNKLFEEERSTDYSIYAFVYVTDENSGTTVHEIVIPVKARAKQGDPSEDPSIDPSIFKDAINSVNASAERAEIAEKTAKEAADKAKEYAESAGKSKGDVEKARDSAISAIGIEKESALRGIESKTVESLQKIQSQAEASQNGINQSIADATKKKTELDGAISNATEAKGNLDKAVQSAGDAKTELDTSVEKAGEAKTALDSSISSAGEKQLALDATVEQAKEVDASLKEQIGSAEQIQANVEQIAKNKADISSLNEDIVDLQDKKITKFYASNQGEKHLVDSDNGKIQDMVIYGMSEQDSTTGANLIDVDSMLNECLVKNDDGTYSILKTETGRFSKSFPVNLTAGTEVRFDADVIEYNGVYPLKLQIFFGHQTISVGKSILLDSDVRELSIYQDNENDVGTYTKFKNAILSIGEERIPYEPYTDGKPSPSPEYPQEIKSVVNPTVKVTNQDGLKVQSLTLNNITLNAISVSSGGNVTIDGKQYIADYVDADRGKFVQRVGFVDIPDNVKWVIQQQKGGYALGYRTFHNAVSTKTGAVMLSNIGKGSVTWKNTFCFGMIDVFWLIPYKNDGTITSDDINAWLAKHPMKVLYQLKEPIETDLAPEEIEALKTLSANYPVTNISVTSDQLDGYTVFNYPISMANGWNYVKKQLGDTRDYIYDMDAKAQDIDIQSAEAYVNSEYAVALTELEV